MNCDRCDVAMTLGSLYEGSTYEAWYCPCCKSRLRTVEMLQADADRAAAAKGMTRVEFDAHMTAESLLSAEPIGAEEQADIERVLAHMAATWAPACEHDEPNPYLPEGSDGG